MLIRGPAIERRLIFMEKALVKMTLSEQIYNILKEDILSGSIYPGDKLINRELQIPLQVR